MSVVALALVKDLMFKSRIMVVARETGADVAFATAPVDAVSRASGMPPDLVLLDLNAPNAFEMAAAVRQVAPGARYVGFYSHVETTLRKQADAAGIEPLPRSAFVERLPDFLAGKS